MNQFFASSGQSIGASASATVLPMKIQGWFPLGLTSLISLQCKGLSGVFCSITIWRHQFERGSRRRVLSRRVTWSNLCWRKINLQQYLAGKEAQRWGGVVQNLDCEGVHWLQVCQWACPSNRVMIHTRGHFQAQEWHHIMHIFLPESDQAIN